MIDFIYIEEKFIIITRSETNYFICGNDSDKTPALLTQSDGESLVREIVNQKIIDFDDYIYLGDVDKKELEDTGDGYKLKKATYITEKEFLEIFEKESFTRRWVYD